jgi:hypothetical protein
MGILDKANHFIFRGRDKREDSNFDLKTLQDDLQRRKKRESEEGQANRENKKRPLIIEEGDYEVIREVKWVPDPLVTLGREQKSDGRLVNPLLLDVKMFLVDVPYIIKGYYDLNIVRFFPYMNDINYYDMPTFQSSKITAIL